MKKIVWKYGLMAGIPLAAFMVLGSVMMHRDPEFEGSMVLGFSSMALCFSLIYFGVKKYRDEFNGGVITFGKAFKVGFFIALIAASMYVFTWVIEYYLFFPDFMEMYTNRQLEQVRLDKELGEQEKIAAEDSIRMWASFYKNPLGVILVTYTEVLPMGILVNLICALLVAGKKKV